MKPKGLRMANGGEHNLGLLVNRARQDVVDSLAPVMDRVGPYINKGVQLAEEYPLVAQAAQVASWPLNAAVGAHGVAQAINDRDLGAGLAAGFGAVPLVGRFAAPGAKALAGTMKSVRQVKASGMSADMARTAARRVTGDAGTLTQAGQLGAASHDQTTRALRGPQPGPFYGGQPPGSN